MSRDASDDGRQIQLVVRMIAFFLFEC